MTEKYVFVYKLFLSLNISDFSLFFYVKTATSLKKIHPLFPSNPPPKIGILTCHPPFLKIWMEAQPPSRKEGAHYG